MAEILATVVDPTEISEQSENAGDTTEIQLRIIPKNRRAETFCFFTI
jgi:hypothetical protein